MKGKGKDGISKIAAFDLAIIDEIRNMQGFNRKTVNAFSYFLENQLFFV